ncbi:hypothetical protein HMN09_00794200 [Mycena chlorophos]|uniref:Protein CPL1-like domain-containing protein n=1 Tax=Mycena chlorophos TaxID=658473 RepID=A0A8H6W8D7_MYCCL|nr:hypothetical protein HMN09_00794200 [Mycena chlorophos]
MRRSSSGAVASSCSCPANTYWSLTNPTAGIGDCLSCPGAPAGSTTCTQPSGGVSPTRRRDTVLSASSCKRGEMLCPIYSGRGGMECVNVQRTTDSCGGCVALPDDDIAYNGGAGFTGRDCTAIPNVAAVDCWHGQCLVESCKEPYQLVDGACV